MKKFGAKRRMRFGRNKIVKRKVLKAPRKKGLMKGKSKVTTKRKERMKKRLSKKSKTMNKWNELIYEL